MAWPHIWALDLHYAKTDSSSEKKLSFTFTRSETNKEQTFYVDGSKKLIKEEKVYTDGPSLTVTNQLGGRQLESWLFYQLTAAKPTKQGSQKAIGEAVLKHFREKKYIDETQEKTGVDWLKKNVTN
ncbi:MAG: hypothetical protein Q9159_003961 [Coniocarpon cinnabarinum]